MMQNALLLACVLLTVGVILRTRVGWLSRYYIPSALIAGLLGLVLVQVAQVVAYESAMADRPIVRAAVAVRSIGSEWSTWRAPLIPIIFAGMLISNPRNDNRKHLRETAQQGIAAWILILGQLVLGLLVTWLILMPAFGVPIHFGQLLEVSWAGGFGSSAAWGALHERMGIFRQARDLAIFFTTCGLLYGVFCGVVLVNIAVRKGWVSATPSHVLPITESEELALEHRPIQSDAIDPLMLQILILAAALLVGIGLQQLLILAAGAAPQRWKLANLATDLPLFVFTMVGGWIVQRFLSICRAAHFINEEWINRLTGVALELLIFVAIATMQLQTIRENWPAAAALMIVGAAWVLFNVVWISPRLLPKRCWFELAIMNHGFATATTAQGMMLLRMVDRDLKTDAARIYALAAPLTGVFIGGGLITYLLPELLTRFSPALVILPATAAGLALFFTGRRLARSAGSK